MKMEKWFNGFWWTIMVNFGKGMSKLTLDLKLFLDLGYIFLWPIRHWHHYFFGHFGQLVKTKIKVIKVKEEKWLIKSKI